MLKEDGKISNKDKKKKHKIIKCQCCRKCNIDIDEAISIGDYEKIGNGDIEIFCPQCGNANLIKI